MTKILHVLDVLDRHQFYRTDSVYNIDVLYTKVFGPAPQPTRETDEDGDETVSNIP